MIILVAVPYVYKCKYEHIICLTVSLFSLIIIIWREEGEERTRKRNIKLYAELVKSRDNHFYA